MSERKKAPGVLFAEAKEKLDSTFGDGASSCLDPLLSLMSRSPILDIISFDKFLKTPDGTSLNDWVKQKYGQEALTLVESLLHPASF